MRRPKLLDLFCGAGGVAVGYHRSGFDIVGVDIAPQKNYPFEFIRADALEYVRAHGHEYEAIHASPPCQAFSSARFLPQKNGHRQHPELVEPTRNLLIASGKPWVIENVVGSPLCRPLLLCGSMFGLAVRRHRLFESSMILFAPGLCLHPTEAKYVAGRSRSSKRANRSTVVMVYGKGGSRGHIGQWKAAMGIDWMTMGELSQAIPPAYTHHIGKQLYAYLEAARAEA